ncbi:MAG TPA: SulP family inorganic anion transporter [Nannocystis sp.]
MPDISMTSGRRLWVSPRDDLPAAIVVFLVALPLCLGIALASGATPLAGITAGVIGGVVVGSLSGSSVSVSGPAAGLTAVVLAGITDLGGYPIFLTAVLLAGMMQLGLGLARAGGVAHFVPVSVVRGMLAAIGLILMLKQIPHALGRDIDYEGDETFVEPGGGNTFSDIAEAVMHVEPGALLVFLVSLGVLLGWSRIVPRIRNGNWFPASLLAVLAGTATNLALLVWWPEAALQASHRVAMPLLSSPGALAEAMQFPDFSHILDGAVWRMAVTLALIASIESLLSAEAADKLDPWRRITPMNRELRAQGVGNIVAALLGALPVTAVIVRSSANVAAGGKTRLATIVHGILLLLSALFLAPWLNWIPLASLAAVLIVMGWRLARPRILLEQYRRGVGQFVPYVVTIMAILLTDLLIGILIGIGVGVFFVVRSNFRSAVIVTRDGDTVLIRFAKDVSFLNKPRLRGIFETITDGTSVIIDGTRAQFIDSDIVECIDDFVVSAPTRDITVELRRSPGSNNELFKTRPPV